MKKSSTTQQLPKEILSLIDAALRNAADKAYSEGRKHRDQEIKDYYKAAERRLYAYPDLVLNLEKYDLDVEDVKTEANIPGAGGRSKSIVYRPVTGGCIIAGKDEILEGKLAIIDSKRKRDQEEIDEVKYALGAIENDPDYMIIEYKYFDNMPEKEIADKVFCDERTVRRHKNRLLRKVMLRFYGADANN